MKTKTLDDNTFASHPGRIRLEPAKLRRFHPELYEPQKSGIFGISKTFSSEQQYWPTHIQEQLIHGDSRAAIVVSIKPLVVAAYTDELDCVALLHFPSDLVKEYNLQMGTRLLTVNTYRYGNVPVADLENGPASYHRYCNFAPFIAEFLSNDMTRIEYRKSQITEAEWQRTWELSQTYLEKHGQRFRDGRPVYCSKPA